MGTLGILGEGDILCFFYVYTWLKILLLNFRASCGYSFIVYNLENIMLETLKIAYQSVYLYYAES